MRTALLSVSNKTNLVPFSQFLLSKNVNILCSGGTFAAIKHLNSPLIKEVSEYTGFPEILGGRVKTLHPKIYGGILACRDKNEHINDITQHSIRAIDLVVSNLYPFDETVKRVGDSEFGNDEIIENIDIGGQALLRAAAKNYKDVLVVTSPCDYDIVMNEWDHLFTPNNHIHINFAQKAWHHVAQYDMSISSYFNKEMIYRAYEKQKDLKYGLNPQQQSAAIYKNVTNNDFPFQVLSGNIGYINVLDAIYSYSLVSELSEILKCDAVASYKHNSPAGVALAHSHYKLTDLERKVFFVPKNIDTLSDIATAFIRARNVDPMCSFGDFIAISGKVDIQTATLISTEVSDGIIASDFDSEALEILKKKKTGNYVILKGEHNYNHTHKKTVEIREMHGVVLTQEENQAKTTFDSITPENTIGFDWVMVGDKLEKQTIVLSDAVKRDLILANTTLKYTQSNSVATACNGQILGVGAGQQSRIDCVLIAGKKTEKWRLRFHPACLKLLDSFVPGTKKTDKINAIVDYVNGYLHIHNNPLLVQPNEIEKLDEDEKRWFLSDDDPDNDLPPISLASDAFFPFRDNIEAAAKFGIKHIIQPGGSAQDDKVIEAVHEQGMTMTMTGGKMRMFLH